MNKEQLVQKGWEIDKITELKEVSPPGGRLWA